MKKDSIKRLTLIYEQKADYYKQLSSYLLLCAYIKDNIKIKINFPPTPEEHNLFNELIDSIEKSEKKIVANAGGSKRLLNDFYKKGVQLLNNIDIKKEESFDTLIICCGYVSVHFAVLAQYIAEVNYLPPNASEIEDLGRDVLIKSYELIGYWQGKMETRKRCSISASTKTLKREDNKKKLIKFLEEHNYKINLDSHKDAEKLIKRREQTTLKLFREIEKETGKNIDWTD